MSHHQVPQTRATTEGNRAGDGILATLVEPVLSLPKANLPILGPNL
jgi:hypothetical protein